VGHFLKNHKIKVFAFVLLFSLFLSCAVKIFRDKQLSTFGTKDVTAGYQSPQIYINGGDGGYSSAGLITLASTDDPAVQIGGYNIAGSAEISMYKADLLSVLNYLEHDKDGKQTKTAPDVNSFQFIATTQHNINTSTYSGSKINLPFEEIGIWYLKVKIGSVNADAFVLRSNTGILVKQGNGEFVLWGQDFKTKKSISGGSIQIYNLKDGQNVIQTTNFDSNGIASATLSQDADIALATVNNDIAIVPLNLKYLNLGSSWNPFAPPQKQTKYFTFTDRPLYKPGDTVYFKSIVRDDDDARYSIPSGNAEVKIYSGYDSKDALSTKNIPISRDGAINGEFKIPENSKVGSYTLSVLVAGRYPNTTYFDVEYYQKPEFYIDVTTPKTELIAGDKSTFKINGNYFSGQPLASQKIKYKVTSSDFYEYQYFNEAQSLAQNLSSDFKYSFWYGSHTVSEGTTTLSSEGEATINLDTKMDFNQGRSQVFSIEATIDDGSQTPSFSRKNVLVYAGQFGIYRTDFLYGGKVNTTINLPLAISSNISPSNLSGVNLTAKVHRENWVKYDDLSQKYPQYKKEEEDLPDLNAKTDSNGKAVINFVPTKLGYYKLTVQGRDSRNNLIAKEFYEYVSAEGQPAYNSGAGDQLTLSFDKQKYGPTDTAKISIYSAIPDRDVFLSLERGRMDRFQIVHLTGNNGVIDVPLIFSDVPNMFAKVSSFANGNLDSNVQNFSVSSVDKRILVNVVPNNKKYGPGDTVNLSVETTDVNHNPVSADVAVWAVDKAIFELSDSTLGNIFDTFWSERYDNTQEAHSLEGIVVYSAEGGGCFVGGTKVLMADGTTKNIEDIKSGDNILTKESVRSSKLVRAKVTSVQTAEDSGYLIINNKLKITPDHVLWVNNSWSTADNIQKGDTLLDSNGNPVNVNTVEWQSAKTKVYNLDVEKYHTFFADGIWVHNQKGGAARSTFKDTAYWNPSVHTDLSGKAKITFKLPDNLTTWTIAAVADSTDTRVGQTTTEVVVSKDITVRPILPNIMRVGDRIVVSALAQNFSDTDHKFDVKLTFDSGKIITPDFNNLLIKFNSMERVTWELSPEKETAEAKLTFSATATSDKLLADTIIQKMPIIPFEFEEKTGESGFGNKSYDIKLSPDLNKNKSNITLSLSPTLLGTLPSAMRYLISYPYGCTEQTVSSMVPALVAKSNQEIFADAIKDKNLDEIVKKGISRLVNLQQYDGSWTWWFNGQDDVFITAYVLDNLVYAKQLGYEVNQAVFDSAKSYLERPDYYNRLKAAQAEYSQEEWVVKNYGLALLGGSNKSKKIDNLEGLSPDLLSIHVMTNYLNGNKNADTNGLGKLVSLANKQGDLVYWNEGSKFNFGSKNASTALAIRAIVLAKGDTNIARQGALYLVRNRQYDYWSNTFGTSQVVRAVVGLSGSLKDLDPDFSYKVSLDGNVLTSGQVDKAGQTIKDIDIPVAKVKSGGSDVKIEIEGQGELYSTILTDEFHTDKNAKSKENGLSIKREYINEKGEQYSLAPGDSVTVKLTVNGLGATENYAVITDELPAGMVPVNPSFNNEQYGPSSQSDQSNYFSSADVTGMDITQNGATLSVYKLDPGEHVFTYRARVVSTGNFSVPPATVSLMYAPEIYGRSNAQNITIGKVSAIIPSVLIQQIIFKYLPSIIGVAAGTVGLVWIIAHLKSIGFFRKKGNPPSENTPSVPTE